MAETLTELYELLDNTGDLSDLPAGDWNHASRTAERVFRAIAEIAGASGILLATDYNGTRVPGERSIDMSAGVALVGDAGGRKWIRSPATIRVTGLPATTNPVYVYKLRNNGGTAAEFLASAAAPPQANAELCLTCQTDGTEVVNGTINQLPAGRVNLYGILMLGVAATLRAHLTIADAINIILGTGTGTKIGTGATQKLGFLGATPVGQRPNNADLRQLLIDFGFLATGGATPLALNGGKLNCDEAEIDGALNHDGTTVGLFGVAPASRPAATDDIKDGLTTLGILQGTSASPLNLDGGKATVGEAEIDGDLNHDGSNVGFYGVAPAARPSAVTQTYATADKTHAARTTAALTDNSGGSAGTTLAAIPDPADTPASADALRDDLVTNVLPKIRDAIASLAAQANAGRTDCQDTAQVVNALVDDLQSLGLEQ